MDMPMEPPRTRVKNATEKQKQNRSRQAGPQNRTGLMPGGPNQHQLPFLASSAATSWYFVIREKTFFEFASDEILQCNAVASWVEK